MRFRNYTVSFALFVSLAILAAPLAIWEAFLGDPLYDSVFERSVSSLPVMKAGRIMPLSSAASDALRSIGGRETATLDGRKISATKWLWRMGALRAKMADVPVFRTDNRDLQKLLGVDKRNYSYNDFARRYEDIYSGAVSGQKTPYARACDDALASALAYAVLANTFGVELPSVEGFGKAVSAWKSAIDAATKEYAAAREQNRKPDESKLVEAADYLSRLRSNVDFEKRYPNSVIRALPYKGGFTTPSEAMLDRDLDWSKEGESAKALFSYGKMLDGIYSGNLVAAGDELSKIFEILEKKASINFFKVGLENVINRVDPFFGGFILYMLGALLIALGAIWRKQRDRSWLVAKVVLACAVGAQCAAILARMYIQMRPPVTNLYSSVVFTGALAALAGLVFFIKNRGVGFGVSSVLTGGVSILVAVNLPHSGDTMGMMRAVLNSNFWLTVHVVTIMVGYCGVFLAGFAAAFRLVCNVFDKGDFGEATGSAARNVYAILCFALMFSFLGTMLGGVWADMSWGRFWGWDPKENGALMIVLWCAAAIHAKALRLVSDRVFLALAVGGNIVVAWAWFGVNLMGVGLHSYGFVEGGWKWFFVFVGLNALIIPLSLIKYKGAEK